jgi:hypothetical protein
MRKYESGNTLAHSPGVFAFAKLFEFLTQQKWFRRGKESAEHIAAEQ